jgi:DNA-directed RNA polymerase specialized sigma24 family protein
VNDVRFFDDDGRQERALALLEGCDELGALRRGRAACADRAIDKLGPKSYIGRLRTLQFAEFHDDANVKPLTMDSRSPQEVEEAFDRRESVFAYLDHLTATQRRVITLRYGFDGHCHTYREICDVLGYAYESAARDREMEGLARIRRAIGQETPEERERREARRAYNTQHKAQRRAERKVA